MSSVVVCARKVKYEKREVANAMRKMEELRHRKLYSYYCDICRYYHLTSKKGTPR